jgi:hypothetical protein
MTTIRAHPPVETPAGPMVALPPVARRTFNGGHGATVMVAPDTPPDVFALAVPCPTCEGTGRIVRPWGDEHPCPACRMIVQLGQRHGWVLHGDYRVLRVLPIVTNNDTWPASDVLSATDGCHIFRYDGRLGWNRGESIDLPGAVPGGVALVVEWVPR